MLYNLEDIQRSQEIFYYLLEHHELLETKEKELFSAYVSNSAVKELLESQAQKAHVSIERFGNAVYVIPHLENHFLGFTKQELKNKLLRKNATERDYYLMQFFIITLLVECYDSVGITSHRRDSIHVDEILNIMAERLEEGVKRASENENADDTEVSYQDMLEAYHALQSNDDGKKIKGSKQGFAHSVLTFLSTQNLIDYDDSDGIIYVSAKLDHLMDWELLNRKHLDRIRYIVRGEKNE